MKCESHLGKDETFASCMFAFMFEICCKFEYFSQLLHLSFLTQCCNLFLHSSEHIFNPRYLPEYTLTVFNDSDGVSRFNCTARLTTKFLTPTLNLELRIKTGKQDKNYNLEVLNIRLTVCKISKGILGSFVIRHFTENLKNYSNFTVTCPLKPDSYHFVNFPAIDKSYLPLSLLRKDLQWLSIATIRGKPAKSKQMVHLLTNRFYGGYSP